MDMCRIPTASGKPGKMRGISSLGKIMELCNCIKNHGEMQRIVENRILLLEGIGERGYVRGGPEVDKTLSSWTLNKVNGVHLKIIKIYLELSGKF